MDLLRFATAGSVDDGKSTLVGRLLYDTKKIFVDQLDSVERTSRARGDSYLDLALLTDGLRAEREQGITIDVAYRYFSTARRKFIIADTPGHVQHTRNMVTGASTADLLLLMVDARRGMTEQTRRHLALGSLLRVPHVLICVNKMDLVDYDPRQFADIEATAVEFVRDLDVDRIACVPTSALDGDNVVERSRRMTWYTGPTVLSHLEHVAVAPRHNGADLRFPVQWVVRPRQEAWRDYRGYAGCVAGGTLHVGDDVVVLPSGTTTTVTAIDTMDGPLNAAFAPMSVVVRVADDLDIARGDMLCAPGNRPNVVDEFEAVICWMAEEPLRAGRRLGLKHTGRWVRGAVTRINFVRDVNTLLRDASANELILNDIGGVTIRTTDVLCVDDFSRNATTGSFILVDERSNVTVAAGMISTTRDRARA